MATIIVCDAVIKIDNSERILRVHVNIDNIFLRVPRGDSDRRVVMCNLCFRRLSGALTRQVHLKQTLSTHHGAKLRGSCPLGSTHNCVAKPF